MYLGLRRCTEASEGWKTQVNEPPLPLLAEINTIQHGQPRLVQEVFWKGRQTESEKAHDPFHSEISAG